MAEQRPNDYIRISTALFDSPKLADIADENGPAAYVVWLHLLCMAKRARHLGRIIAPPVRVARMVGIDVQTATAIISALESRRCIVALDDAHHYEIRNWLTWQSMTPAERVRKHRETQPVTDVTQTAMHVTESVTNGPQSVSGVTQTKTMTMTKTRNRAHEPAHATPPPQPIQQSTNGTHDTTDAAAVHIAEIDTQVDAADRAAALLTQHMSGGTELLRDRMLSDMDRGVPIPGTRRRQHVDAESFVRAAQSWHDDPPTLAEPRKAWGYFLQTVPSHDNPIEATVVKPRTADDILAEHDQREAELRAEWSKLK